MTLKEINMRQNIRHLQHHVGQITERLRSFAGIGLDWVIAIGKEKR